MKMGSFVFWVIDDPFTPIFLPPTGHAHPYINPLPSLRSMIMGFFFTYVLFSDADKLLYIGYTSNINRRLKCHENGEVKSTAVRRPLRLIYYEAHLTQSAAIKREKYFKTTSGRRTLNIMLRETLHDLGYKTLNKR